MEITKGSWDALIGGQAIERMGYRIRMKKMAAQIERLSKMVEEGWDDFIEPEYGYTLEEAEEDYPRNPLRRT